MKAAMNERPVSVRKSSPIWGRILLAALAAGYPVHTQGAQASGPRTQPARSLGQCLFPAFEPEETGRRLQQPAKAVRHGNE